MIKVALLLSRGAVCTVNTVKTAIQISRINFYFVTAFYSLYDICMVDMKVSNKVPYELYR